MWLIYGLSVLVTSVAGACAQRRLPGGGPALTLLAVTLAIELYAASVFRPGWRLGAVVTMVAITALPSTVACLALIAARRWWIAFRILAACVTGVIVASMTSGMVLSLACGSIATC